MKPETRAALAHFLVHEGVAVAEALGKTIGIVDQKVGNLMAYRSDDGMAIWTRTMKENWEHDHWQAARPVHREKAEGYAATWRKGEPLFRRGSEELTGDELADALRDWALGETK